MPSRQWILAALVLLTINWLIAGSLYHGPQPATIAYSPLFPDQIRAADVKEISTALPTRGPA